MAASSGHSPMRHMLVGRVVYQHVTLFEPEMWVKHLRALTDLVSRSVLVPAAVHALTENRPANVSGDLGVASVDDLADCVLAAAENR